jgi:predicted nucleic acid-binding protein
MSADFLDSNILLYLAWSDQRKSIIVEELLQDQPTISVQVINEVTNVLRGKRKLDWPIVNGFIEDLLPITVVLPLTQDTNRSARSLAARYGFAWYDAVIVASALEARCARLYTEDMHHGQKIGDLTIVNPFRYR